MPTVINVYDTVASIGVNDPEASLTIYEMFIGVGPTGATGATGPAGASGVAGKLPNSYAELSSPEGVTSATLVDIPGMSTTITLEEAVEIAVLCSFELQTQDGSSASTIGIAVNINGTDYDSYSRYLSGSNDTGIGAITHRSSELAPGTYTVKMRFQRTSGVSTPGVNHMDMLVMGLQGAQGADGTDGIDGTNGTVTAVTDATSDMLFGVTNVWTKKTLAESKTILGITNAPNVATDATSDMMFGVANAWAKKTLAEGKTLLGVDVLQASVNGWTPATGTWTYASATTITVPSGAAAIYSVGDKIKLTANSVVLYAYIVTVADTLLTVAGNALTNHTFSGCYYSKASSPLGFPQWFDLTGPTWTTTGTAFTNQPTNNAQKFSIVGRQVFFTGTMTTHATSGGTGVFIATFTAGQLPGLVTYASGSAYNITDGMAGLSFLTVTDTIRIAKYDYTAIAGNSKLVTYQINYLI